MNAQIIENIQKATIELVVMQGVLKEVVSVLLQEADRSSPAIAVLDASVDHRRH